MGITDIENENVWKFVTDNKSFDPNNGLFSWREGEPNNKLINGNYEHCAEVLYENLELNDVDCKKSFYGLCEILK